MNNVTKTIYKYWQKTPELFSEKYEKSFREYLSPVGLFLMLRRNKTAQLAGLVKNKRILDVACGSGIFMIDFIKKGAVVTGIDYSQKMLNIAEKNLNKYKISKSKYKLIKADATRIPLKSSTYDLIIATGLTDYLSDEQDRQFLKEAERLLKKRGKVIVSFPSTKSPFSILRSGAGLLLRQKLAKLPPIRNNFTEQKLKTFLRKAGFKNIRKTKIMATMWLVLAEKK